MKKLMLSFFIVSCCFLAQAQKKKSDISGEYYLRGIAEVSSGFKLKKDSTFQFYFSYEAISRYGAGTWSVENDSIIHFSTREKPANDFALVKTEKRNKDSLAMMPITIKVTDANKKLLSHVFCTLHSTDVAYEQTTDTKGEIQFPKQSIDSIFLIFEFSPERNTSFCIELQDRENDYFEFKFEPWIAEVFFDKLSLLIVNDKLKGKHPLFEGDNFYYIPSKK